MSSSVYTPSSITASAVLMSEQLEFTEVVSSLAEPGEVSNSCNEITILRNLLQL